MIYVFLRIDVHIMYFIFSFSTTFIREDGCTPPLLYIRLLLCSDFFRYFHRNYLPRPKHVLLIICCFVIYVFLSIFVQTTKVVYVFVALLKCTLWLLLQLVDNVWNMMIFCRGFESHLPPIEQARRCRKTPFCFYCISANLFASRYDKDKMVA